MTAVASAIERNSAWVSARVGLLMYTLLIVYASGYPFSSWHNIGIKPFAFFAAPFPHYWTKFDVVTNVIGYAPFGILTVFALYPALRGIAAFVLATIAGILLSGAIEAVQTYLPSRVPSNLDLLANSAGACLGALVGVLLSRSYLEQSGLLKLRDRWFSREAGRGLIVVALWPLAQIYPQAYLFGHGQLTPILSGWITELLGRPIDIGAMFRHSEELTVEQYWLSETLITAAGMTGALLTLSCMMRNRTPKAALVLLLLVVTLTAKSLANALHFSPENAFVWITPGAEGGLLCGAVMISGLIFAPPLAQRRVAALTLLISLAVVNIAPPNPYFMSTLQGWLQGRFLNFNGAAQFLTLLWPFLTLWFLLHPVHRRKSE